MNQEALFPPTQSNDPEVSDLEVAAKSNKKTDPEVLDQGVPQEYKPEMNTKSGIKFVRKPEITTKSVIKFVRKENEISDQGVPSERQLEVVRNENAVSDQGDPRKCQLEVDTKSKINFFQSIDEIKVRGVPGACKNKNEKEKLVGFF